MDELATWELMARQNSVEAAMDGISMSGFMSSEAIQEFDYLNAEFNELEAEIDRRRNEANHEHLTIAQQRIRANSMVARFKTCGQDALWAYGKGGGFWIKDRQPAYISMKAAITELAALERDWRTNEALPF